MGAVSQPKTKILVTTLVSLSIPASTLRGVSRDTVLPWKSPRGGRVSAAARGDSVKMPPLGPSLCLPAAVKLGDILIHVTLLNQPEKGNESRCTVCGTNKMYGNRRRFHVKGTSA